MNKNSKPDKFKIKIKFNSDASTVTAITLILFVHVKLDVILKKKIKTLFSFSRILFATFILFRKVILMQKITIFLREMFGWK